ncbi:MAG: hypothetical protein ACI9BD_000102 [Candidatus Marinamargulisbacteria bacterium]|jgi:hypothetical protein
MVPINIRRRADKWNKWEGNMPKVSGHVQVSNQRRQTVGEASSATSKKVSEKIDRFFLVSSKLGNEREVRDLLNWFVQRPASCEKLLKDKVAVKALCRIQGSGIRFPSQFVQFTKNLAFSHAFPPIDPVLKENAMQVFLETLPGVLPDIIGMPNPVVESEFPEALNEAIVALRDMEVSRDNFSELSDLIDIMFDHRLGLVLLNDFKVFENIVAGLELGLKLSGRFETGLRLVSRFDKGRDNPRMARFGATPTGIYGMQTLGQFGRSEA